MFDDATKSAVNDLSAKYDYNPAEVLAVLDVESAGIPFWNINGQQLPPVRWEGHYFYARLSGDKLKQAIDQGLASPKAGKIANPASYAARYDLIAKAELIDKEAAIESASWGLGQVMGANWKALGYASADAFLEANSTVAGQVEAVLKFIENNGLRTALTSHDWAGFAQGYNGSGYKKNAYDTKLAAAFAKYAGGSISAVAYGTDEITQLQNMLNKLGDYKLKNDGVLGNETKTAIRDFQLKNGLTVDGIYGPITRESVSRAYIAANNKSVMNAGIGSTGGASAGAVLAEAAKQIQPIAGTSQIIQYVFIGLIVLGALVTAYTMIKRFNQ